MKHSKGYVFEAKNEQQSR
ncbi:MAG: hypothetical protein ACRCYL_16720 [Kluyvera sp.]